MISFNTSKFEGAHKKKPRGFGFWAFQIGGQTIYSKGSMSFTDAKKMAKEEAAKKKVSVIYVLP